MFFNAVFLKSFDGNKLAISTFMADLRVLLDPSWGDEMDSPLKGAQFDSFREKRVAVWTTYEWDLEKKEVTVWMSQRFVEEI